MCQVPGQRPVQSCRESYVVVCRCQPVCVWPGSEIGFGRVLPPRSGRCGGRGRRVHSRVDLLSRWKFSAMPWWGRWVQQFASARLHPPFHERVHPRHPDPAEYDLDPRLLQDLPHRGGGHLHAHNQQLAVDPPVAPAGILPRQTQHENADRAHHTRPTRTLGRERAAWRRETRSRCQRQHSVRAHQQPCPAQYTARESVQQRGQLSGVALRRSTAVQGFAAGPWRRAGGQGVAGSNPVVPTSVFAGHRPFP